MMVPAGDAARCQQPGQTEAGKPRCAFIASTIRPVRQRGDAELGVGRRPDRVVDLGDDPGHLERLDRQLGGHDVAVVALGEGKEDVGTLYAGPTEDILVGTVAAHGLAAERRRQPLEGASLDVEDDHLVAALVPQLRGRGAHAPAAHDHDLHQPSSFIGSRTTHTVQGAFWRM